MSNNKQKIKKIDELYSQFTERITFIRGEILEILKKENKIKTEQRIKEIKQEIDKIN